MTLAFSAQYVFEGKKLLIFRFPTFCVGWNIFVKKTTSNYKWVIRANVTCNGHVFYYMYL